MSSDAENAKNSSTETEKKENDVESEPKTMNEKEVKPEKEAEEKKEEKTNTEIKPDKSPTSDEKVDKQNNEVKKENDKEKEEAETEKEEKEEKNDKKVNNDSNDTEEAEGSDKEEKKEEDKGVPLLDQPLEQSGTRERKKVQRYSEDLTQDTTKEVKAEIPNGSGIQLGEIPRIDASISRFKTEDLKLLHKLLFKVPGKTAVIKKNIKKFNGFDFKKDSEEYNKKMGAAQRFEFKQLKSICEMLDLEKKGSKDDICERIIDFLIEPKDSGKTVGGGRPKRTAAVKANNRGYSSHDDSYSSDERQAMRSRRDKGKRTNLKDDSSSGSDEDFYPSDEDGQRGRSTRGGKRKRKGKASEEDVSDVEESASSDESDEEPKKKKRGNAKVVNNKSKGKATPKTRGRKPAPKKKTPQKQRGRKREESSEEEEEESGDRREQDDGSSSEDEPLAKKTKTTQPPTDDEIKSYVKEILDGANLEEITMKTVCKKVYAHYPDFDLAHKKEFIKETVKSLIST